MPSLSSIFLTVLNMSITAGIIALLLFLLRPVLLRLPRIFAYLLWLPVFFRLLCPVSFTSIFSLFGVTDSGARASAPVAVLESQPTTTVASAMEWADPPTAASMQLLPLVAAIWLLGVVVLLSYGLFSWWRLHRRLGTALRLSKGVYSSDRVDTPFVFGLWRPAIYLPAGTGDEDRDCLLRHERVHLRRGDYLTKPLGYLALCIHWFNPLVWVSVWLAGRDMETSCDELVLSQLGSSARQQYSLLLLRMAADKHSGAVGMVSFGEPDVKLRIQNALRYKHPAVKMVVLGCVLVAALTVGLLANPSVTAPDTEQTAPAPLPVSSSHALPEPAPQPEPPPTIQDGELGILPESSQPTLAAEPVTQPLPSPEQLQPVDAVPMAEPTALTELDEVEQRALDEKREQLLNGEGIPEREMIWPVDGGYVAASIFAYKGHAGTDIAAPAGTDIYAGAAGTVSYAVNTTTGAYGRRVDIDHGDGLMTRYAMCSEVLVETGDTVTQGQLIARVGKTGNASGNHLHFEVRYGEDGFILNPSDYIGTKATAK